MEKELVVLEMLEKKNTNLEQIHDIPQLELSSFLLVPEVQAGPHPCPRTNLTLLGSVFILGRTGIRGVVWSVAPSIDLPLAKYPARYITAGKQPFPRSNALPHCLQSVTAQPWLALRTKRWGHHWGWGSRNERQGGAHEPRDPLCAFMQATRCRCGASDGRKMGRPVSAQNVQPVVEHSDHPIRPESRPLLPFQVVDHSTLVRTVPPSGSPPRHF